VDGHLRDLVTRSGAAALGPGWAQTAAVARFVHAALTAELPPGVADPTWTPAPSMNFTITTPFSVL
jgi:hypothetical protein